MPSARMRIGAALMGAVFGMAIAAGATLAAPANTPLDRAEAAYVAMGMTGNYRLDGGAQARDVLVTLVTRGSMQQWDPGESESVGDLMKPDVGTSTFVSRWDRAAETARTEWIRPKAGGGTRTYTEIFSKEGGYVTGVDSNGPPTKRTVQGATPIRTMSGLRLRAVLRELERSNIVLAMHDFPGRLSEFPSQTVGGKTYPAVQYRGDNATFIVMFDPATSLPAIVRTRDFDYLMGDANFDANLSDFRDVDGVKLPYRITYTLNGVKVWDTTISAYQMNTTLPADAFNTPRGLQGKAVPPAPLGQVPYQWVLRRLASGFFLDSDSLYTDDGGQLTLTDVAPNISLVTGSTHNTLFVATGKYLVAFESPGDDGQSQIAIDLAMKKYPGQPIKYLVLTHHHIDHTGGMRAYVAAGATVVAGKGTGAFYRKALSAPQGLNNHPPKGAVAPRVIEVSDKWSVDDGGRVVEAYLLDNAHAQGYLMPYVPDAKLGFVTDLWGPGAPVTNVNPNMIAVVKGVEKRGLKPEKFAGGHGSVGNYADLEKAVQAAGGGR